MAALSQIPPHDVTESNRRQENNTRLIAETYVRRSVEMANHRLTCEKDKCRDFRELLGVEVLTPYDGDQDPEEYLKDRFE